MKYYTILVLFVSTLNNSLHCVVAEDEDAKDVNLRGNLLFENEPSRLLASDESIQVWEDLFYDVIVGREEEDVVASPYSDKFRVKYNETEKICYISADYTDEDEDWWWNSMAFPKDIKGSKYTTTESYRKWYWKKVWWVWVYTYKWSTRNKTVSDVGVGGWVTPFNAAADAIEDSVKSKCYDATKLTYTGYSRGGGHAQIIALQHFRKGLFEGKTVSLVLFASPQTLGESSAQALKSNIDEAINIVRYTQIDGFSTNIYDIVPFFHPGYSIPTSPVFVKCSVSYDENGEETVSWLAHKCSGLDMVGAERL